MKFFMHDVFAFDDDKIFQLVEKHGMGGYGFYWKIIECLYQQDDNGFRIEASDMWIKRLARSCFMSDYLTVVRYLDSCSELGLINAQLWADRVIFSDAVQKRGDKYIQEKIAGAERKRIARQLAKLQKQIVLQDNNNVLPDKSNISLDNGNVSGVSRRKTPSYPYPDPYSDLKKEEINKREISFSESPLSATPEPEKPLKENILLSTADQEKKESVSAAAAKIEIQRQIASDPEIAPDQPKKAKPKGTKFQERFIATYNEVHPSAWAPNEGGRASDILSGINKYLKALGDEETTIDYLRRSMAWAAKNPYWGNNPPDGNGKWTLMTLIRKDRMIEWAEQQSAIAVDPVPNKPEGTLPAPIKLEGIFQYAKIAFDPEQRDWTKRTCLNLHERPVDQIDFIFSDGHDRSGIPHPLARKFWALTEEWCNKPGDFDNINQRVIWPAFCESEGISPDDPRARVLKKHLETFLAFYW